MMEDINNFIKNNQPAYA